MLRLSSVVLQEFYPISQVLWKQIFWSIDDDKIACNNTSSYVGLIAAEKSNGQENKVN